MDFKAISRFFTETLPSVIDRIVHLLAGVEPPPPDGDRYEKADEKKAPTAPDPNTTLRQRAALFQDSAERGEQEEATPTGAFADAPDNPYIPPTFLVPRLPSEQSRLVSLRDNFRRFAREAIEGDAKKREILEALSTEDVALAGAARAVLDHEGELKAMAAAGSHETFAALAGNFFNRAFERIGRLVLSGPEGWRMAGRYAEDLSLGPAAVVNALSQRLAAKGLDRFEEVWGLHRIAAGQPWEDLNTFWKASLDGRPPSQSITSLIAIPHDSRRVVPSVLAELLPATTAAIQGGTSIDIAIPDELGYRDVPKGQASSAVLAGVVFALTDSLLRPEGESRSIRVAWERDEQAFVVAFSGKKPTDLTVFLNLAQRTEEQLPYWKIEAGGDRIIIRPAPGDIIDPAAPKVPRIPEPKPGDVIDTAAPEGGQGAAPARRVSQFPPIPPPESNREESYIDMLTPEPGGVLVNFEADPGLFDLLSVAREQAIGVIGVSGGRAYEMALLVDIKKRHIVIGGIIDARREEGEPLTAQGETGDDKIHRLKLASHKAMARELLREGRALQDFVVVKFSAGHLMVLPTTMQDDAGTYVPASAKAFASALSIVQEIFAPGGFRRSETGGIVIFEPAPAAAPPERAASLQLPPEVVAAEKRVREIHGEIAALAKRAYEALGGRPLTQGFYDIHIPPIIARIDRAHSELDALRAPLEKQGREEGWGEDVLKHISGVWHDTKTEWSALTTNFEIWKGYVLREGRIELFHPSILVRGRDLQSSVMRHVDSLGGLAAKNGVKIIVGELPPPFAGLELTEDAINYLNTPKPGDIIDPAVKPSGPDSAASTYPQVSDVPAVPAPSKIIYDLLHLTADDIVEAVEGENEKKFDAMIEMIDGLSPEQSLELTASLFDAADRVYANIIKALEVHEEGNVRQTAQEMDVRWKRFARVLDSTSKSPSAGRPLEPHSWIASSIRQPLSGLGFSTSPYSSSKNVKENAARWRRGFMKVKKPSADFEYAVTASRREFLEIFNWLIQRRTDTRWDGDKYIIGMPAHLVDDEKKFVNSRGMASWPPDSERDPVLKVLRAITGWKFQVNEQGKRIEIGVDFGKTLQTKGPDGVWPDIAGEAMGRVVVLRPTPPKKGGGGPEGGQGVGGGGEAAPPGSPQSGQQGAPSQGAASRSAQSASSPRRALKCCSMAEDPPTQGAIILYGAEDEETPRSVGPFTGRRLPGRVVTGIGRAVPGGQAVIHR